MVIGIGYGTGVKSHHLLTDLTGYDDHSQYLYLSPAASSRNVLQPTGAGFIPLTIKGAAAQSADLQEWQDSGSNLVAAIGATGKLTVKAHGSFGADSLPDDGSLLYPGSTFLNLISSQETITDLSVDYVQGMTQYLNLAPTSPPASSVYGLDLEIVTGSDAYDYPYASGGYFSVTHNGTGTLSFAQGLQGAVYGSDHVAAAVGVAAFAQNGIAVTGTDSEGWKDTATPGTTKAIFGLMRNTGVVAAGTDTSYGLDLSVIRTGAAGGTINTYGIHLGMTLDTAGAGTHTAYGLYFDNVTGADVNYAIYTNLGTVRFGGDLIFNGTQKIIGGTGTTDDLTLQTTSGVGATGADMHFLVGNNGATEALTILNNGNVGIGTSAPGAKLQIDAATASTPGLRLKTTDGDLTNKLLDILDSSNTSIFSLTPQAQLVSNVTLGTLPSTNYTHSTYANTFSGVYSSSYNIKSSSTSLTYQGTGTSGPTIVAHGYSLTLGSSTQAVGEAYALTANASVFKTSATGNISVLSAAKFNSGFNFSAGSLFNSYTLFVSSPSYTAGTVSVHRGLYVQSQLGVTGATIRSIFTDGGTVEFQTGAAATIGLIVKAAASQSANLSEWQDSSANILGLVAASGAAIFKPRDAGTSAVLTVLTLGHNSSGTPAAGFGTGLLLTGQDSTTADVSMARIRSEWVVATHASRTARLILGVNDASAEREGMRIEASGSAAMIGFFGAPAVVQPTTAGAAATFVANTSGIADDSATFDGYTIGQIVKALRNLGVLA